jgi:hypothetical protein
VDALDPSTDTTGNIAERIKRRHGSPETKETDDGANTTTEPAGENATSLEDSSQKDFDQQDGSESEEANGTDEDENVAISVFVRREREAHGKPTSAQDDKL